VFTIYGFDAAMATNTAYLIWYTPGTASSSQVLYDTSPALNNASVMDPTMVETHNLTLNGLQPNTTYYFQAVSVDANGNVSYSNVIQKTTKP
jgi:hypothetical protein